MSRCYSILFVQWLGVLALAMSASTDAFSLDDKILLQQLTEELVHIKIRMEDVTKNYMEIKEVLKGKDNRQEELELKVSRLEEKVHQQKTQMIALQQQTKGRQINSVELIPHMESNSQHPMGKSSSFSRTCRELRATDPSLASGMHWIDPDGQGVGDDPIYVYCDMAKGSTSIPHDSELLTDVGHCADPGCYSRSIHYNATMRQMITLADLSSECHQSIKYDCNFAPFEIAGVTYSWWNDRNGTARYFWSGSNASVHTCQCGIDHNCVESVVRCNCDTAAPVPLTDNGEISDKRFLPITRLNFGRTQLASSSGLHTLGRLECTGQLAVVGMPKSCTDLWRIGHSLSGLYSVMRSGQVESVYCDFFRLPEDSEFEKWIGYVDVKSLPVYFYVQKNTPFNQINTPIRFEVDRLNIGNAMNLTSGKFTTPRSGVYTFTFSGRAYYPSSSSFLHFIVGIYLNGNFIGDGHSSEISTVAQWESFSLQSTLNLQAGDEIWLEIRFMSTGTSLYDDGYHSTHFTGLLLKETLLQ